MTKIICPSCNHHLFTIEEIDWLLSPPAATIERRNPPAKSALVDELMQTVRDFLGDQEGVRWGDARLSPCHMVIDAIRAWEMRQGRQASSKQALGRALKALGVESVKSNGRRYYRGLSFTGSFAGVE